VHHIPVSWVSVGSGEELCIDRLANVIYSIDHFIEKSSWWLVCYRLASFCKVWQDIRSDFVDTGHQTVILFID